ncbi:MAG TPA: TetR/AcrR family transcriptional regulator [Solirubrobacteraceae bacterium]|nr:TetR/AcrR family transcriptional regulator [Solirubrobacteraceae bacterium]
MGISGTTRGLAPMYRQLPHGPHGMTREDVARNQRTRVYGAMIESISKYGYRASTVAGVIGLAGVSRRAFYEQFANKEQCFLATYDLVVARSRKLAIDSWEQERGWANRIHAAFQRCLEDIAVAPKGPHLVFVDSLGIGPAARARLQLAASTQERLLTAGFDAAPDGVKLPQLISKAIVGGIRHIACTRLREQREQELLNLTDELLDWVSAYRTPPGARLNALMPKQPLHIPSTFPAFLTSGDVRSRTLGSVVHLTLDEGYAEVTDPQIAQFAGTSTEAFHKQFTSKQECFLAVVDELAREVSEVVLDSMGDASCWSEEVRPAVSAFVEFFVARPSLIRIAFIDLFEVGPAMVKRMTTTIESFTKMLDEAGPEPHRAPEIAAEAITGAIWAIISSYATNDRLGYLPYLVDHITFIVLAPYVGAKQAMKSIEASRPEDLKSGIVRVHDTPLEHAPAALAHAPAASRSQGRRPARSRQHAR